MTATDPWLAARMHNRVQVAAGEQVLGPAVRAALDEYLSAVRSGLGLGGAVTAAASDDDREPDWSGFPDDSLWRRIVGRRIAPAWRRVFGRSYRRTAPDAPDVAGDTRADDEAEQLAERLRQFPRRVWSRIRETWRDGIARGESPAALRARVAELATLEGWDGAATTMTRTEVIGALNGGSMGAALDEQARTRRPWVKTWLATADERTRAEHRAADGQARPLAEPFSVGTDRVQFPGDPRARTFGTIANCRCSLTLGPAPE
ncbi:phage minor head protein [Streptomyces sp. NPDC000927]|uniref:phage minor head protein n=1 Tax=Streptomyces sp. NPDC000927 TaxID=3154371 RepID=UPI003323881A